MIKKTAIVFISLIVISSLYVFYCNQFWEDYWKNHAIYDTNNKLNDQKIYNFTPHRDLPADTLLSNDVLMRYHWKRQLIEPAHSMWINEVEINFEPDSTLFYRVTAHYFYKNYWTYPLFRNFRCAEENTYTHNFQFDKESMTFIDQWQDTIKITFENNTLSTDHIFL